MGVNAFVLDSRRVLHPAPNSRRAGMQNASQITMLGAIVKKLKGGAQQVPTFAPLDVDEPHPMMARQSAIAPSVLSPATAKRTRTRNMYTRSCTRGQQWGPRCVSSVMARRGQQWGPRCVSSVMVALRCVSSVMVALRCVSSVALRCRRVYATVCLLRAYVVVCSCTVY